MIIRSKTLSKYMYMYFRQLESQFYNVKVIRSKTFSEYMLFRRLKSQIHVFIVVTSHVVLQFQDFFLRLSDKVVLFINLTPLFTNYLFKRRIFSIIWLVSSFILGIKEARLSI